MADINDMDAEELRSELIEVTAQRDLLREMVAVMQPHMTHAGQAAFERWKDEGAQRIAAALHVKLMEQG